MKLLISQKEGVNEHRVKIDSLELDYVKFFTNEEFEVIPVPNNLEALESLLKLEPDALVLSGGGDIHKQLNRNKIEKRMIDYSLNNNIPLLGICRGMQQINKYFGGKLSPNKNYPKIRKHSLIITNDKFILALQRSRGPVNSYHNFVITERGLADRLSVFGISNYGLIEAFEHKFYNIIGIQWHPERMNYISDWIDKHIINFLKGELQ